MNRPSFSIGIEEEYQTIDPETRDLRSHVQRDLAEGKLLLKERVKPEMHQSVIEVGPASARTSARPAQNIGSCAARSSGSPREHGMRAGGRRHAPFLRLGDQEIYPDERYASSSRTCSWSRAPT